MYSDDVAGVVIREAFYIKSINFLKQRDVGYCTDFYYV